MTAIGKLSDRMRTGDTLACCGLDPDLARIPSEVTGSDEERVFEFLTGIVDETASHVCAYKVQKAFFDRLHGGHDVLVELVQYVHNAQPGLPVFIDCKIGDIDNTMRAYVDLLLGEVGADGVLVNPYMGDEVLQAFGDYPDRAVIVLARTSNSGAAVVQDALMADGRPMWQYMLQLVVERWNGNDNLIPVISSTAGLDMRTVRPMIPDTMPILLAGVGAQGGDYSDISALLNSGDAGVFVNSSRGLLFPSTPDDMLWRESTARAVVAFKDELNRARRK
jgi:orotidine-5'-phosphate decarboxylase